VSAEPTPTVAASDHPRLRRLATPASLSIPTVPGQTAVDAAMVGHLAGVTLGGTVFVFLYWGLACLRRDTMGLTAQAEGARDLGAAAASN